MEKNIENQYYILRQGRRKCSECTYRQMYKCKEHISFWYILFISQNLVVLLELLILPACIQALWHRMAHRKNRNDCASVSAVAPIVPSS